MIQEAKNKIVEETINAHHKHPEGWKVDDATIHGISLALMWMDDKNIIPAVEWYKLLKEKMIENGNRI